MQYASLIFLWFLAVVSAWLKHKVLMIVFFPLHTGNITKYNLKRYDRSDRFYCCFRNRAVSCCLGILCIEN